MGAVQVLIICLAAVWLRKGSCLPVDVPNEMADHVEQNIKYDLSPDDDDVMALLQSEDARLKQHAKEVYLETKEVDMIAGDDGGHNVRKSIAVN